MSECNATVRLSSFDKNRAEFSVAIDDCERSQGWFEFVLVTRQTSGEVDETTFSGEWTAFGSNNVYTSTGYNTGDDEVIGCRVVESSIECTCLAEDVAIIGRISKSYPCGAPPNRGWDYQFTRGEPPRLKKYGPSVVDLEAEAPEQLIKPMGEIDISQIDEQQQFETDWPFQVQRHYTRKITRQLRWRILRYGRIGPETTFEYIRTRGIEK